jgi:hypothetical protein
VKVVETDRFDDRDQLPFGVLEDFELVRFRVPIEASQEVLPIRDIHRHPLLAVTPPNSPASSPSRRIVKHFALPRPSVEAQLPIARNRE